eukprot:135633-Amphidinium_carterae.9
MNITSNDGTLIEEYLGRLEPFQVSTQPPRLCESELVPVPPVLSRSGARFLGGEQGWGIHADKSSGSAGSTGKRNRSMEGHPKSEPGIRWGAYGPQNVALNVAIAQPCGGNCDKCCVNDRNKLRMANIFEAERPQLASTSENGIPLRPRWSEADSSSDEEPPPRHAASAAATQSAGADSTVAFWLIGRAALPVCLSQRDGEGCWHLRHMNSNRSTQSLLNVTTMCLKPHLRPGTANSSDPTVGRSCCCSVETFSVALHSQPVFCSSGGGDWAESSGCWSNHSLMVPAQQQMGNVARSLVAAAAAAALG